MVWPAAEPLRTLSSSIVESSHVAPSSPSASYSESLPLHSQSSQQQQQQQQQYHRRQSTNHRPPQSHKHIPPTSPSPSPSSSQTTQEDWHHHRQQQWLDRIPYDLPPQHPLLITEPSSSQSTSSSMPSTAPMPCGFVNNMPGSYYYSRSNSPSAEEQAMFHLAHDPRSPLPSRHPTNSSSLENNNRLLSPPPSSPFSQIQDPFPSIIPSAQPPRFIPPHKPSYEQSPPPFTNISSSSTQPATTPLFPSPPPSHQEQPHGYRPASPTSVADSQPTLRQAALSRQQEEEEQEEGPEYSSLTSPIPRPQVMSHIHSHAYGHSSSASEIGSGSGSGGRYGNGTRLYPRTAEETEAQALSAVVEGIGRMQVNMNLDQAGRWRIARRADAPW
ncbi:hypothetical protein V8C26DRAFT_211560 [Trichoderma gracile]